MTSFTLTKQQQKVYDYIAAHPGCTTHDIQFDAWVSCPSGRITELRKKGVPIVSVGQKEYAGAHPFEKYAIPARIVAGLFLFSLLVLLFDYFGLVSLADIGKLARPIFIIAALLCGSLSLTGLLGVAFDAEMQRRKVSLLSHRRDLRRAEVKQSRAEFEQDALKRIEYLSTGELHYIADCLRKNEQSFLAWGNSPDVTNLMATGLVATPGGVHDADHYPFYIVDFAWQGLLARKDEVLAKDIENIRRAAAKKAAQGRRVLR